MLVLVLVLPLRTSSSACLMQDARLPDCQPWLNSAFGCSSVQGATCHGRAEVRLAGHGFRAIFVQREEAPSIRTTDSMDSRSRLQTSFTPLQLMSTYKRILLAAEPQLNFEYIGFTIASARLPNAVSQQIGPKLGLKDWVKGKLGLKVGETAKHIHVDLVDRHLLRASPSSSDMSEVGSLFSNHISRSGKHFVKQAHDAFPMIFDPGL